MLILTWILSQNIILLLMFSCMYKISIRWLYKAISSTKVCRIKIGLCSIYRVYIYFLPTWEILKIYGWHIFIEIHFFPNFVRETIENVIFSTKLTPFTLKIRGIWQIISRFGGMRKWALLTFFTLLYKNVGTKLGISITGFKSVWV